MAEPAKEQDGTSRQSKLDFRDGRQGFWMDVKTMIVVVGAIIGGTIFAIGCYNGISNQIKTLNDTIIYQAWTIDDHVAWSEALKAANPTLTVPSADTVIRANRLMQQQQRQKP